MMSTALMFRVLVLLCVLSLGLGREHIGGAVQRSAVHKHRAAVHQHLSRHLRRKASLHHQAYQQHYRVNHSDGTSSAEDGVDDEDDYDDDVDASFDDQALEKQEAEATAAERATQEKDLQAEVSRAETKLLHNIKKQEMMKAQINDLKRPKESSVIDANVAAVANETQSSALANMLGDMWRDLRAFAAPGQVDYLEESLKKLEAEQPLLEKEVQWAEGNLTAQKQVWSEEDAQAEELTPAPVVVEETATAASPVPAEIEETTTEAPETSTQPVAGIPVVSHDGKYTAYYNKDTMPPVSASMFNVLYMAWLVFICHTLLAVVRTYNQHKGRTHMHLQVALEGMCSAVNYAPVLAVLFLAVRLRAIHLAHGHTEKQDLPPEWVQVAMYAVSGLLAVEVILSFLVGHNMPDITDESNKEHYAETRAGNARSVKMYNKISYAVMCLLQAGVLAVLVGAVFMPPPEEIWGDQIPPADETLTCCLLIVWVFWIIAFGHWISASLLQESRAAASKAKKDADKASADKSEEEAKQAEAEKKEADRALDVHEKLEHLFKRGRHVMHIGPMLCILYFAARMRALQIFPEEGYQQGWAKRCQLMSAICLSVEAALSIIIPLCDNKIERGRGTSAGEVNYYLSNSQGNIMYTILRTALVVAVYLGAFGVLMSMVLLKSPRGYAHTPPISPALQCVIMLQQCYFTVSFSIHVVHAVRDVLNKKYAVHRLVGIFEAGMQDSVFATVICLLLVATRLRAIQLTRTTTNIIPPDANTQYWVQESMHIATACFFVLLLMTYLSAYLMGTGVNMDWEQPDVVPISKKHKDYDYMVEKIKRRSSCDAAMLNIPRCLYNMSTIFDGLKYLSLIILAASGIVIMYAIFDMTPEKLSPYSGASGLHVPTL